jgi:hypothetical protein
MELGVASVALLVRMRSVLAANLSAACSALGFDADGSWVVELL